MPQQMTSTLQPIGPLMGGRSRTDSRHAVESSVALRFEDLERRVDGRALNISGGGMFIRSRDARPAGSPIAFELSLGGAGRPIQGAGEVVWMRRFELAADQPAGMGIRFLDLDEKSDRKLRSFIAEHADGDRAGGGSPAGHASRTASTYLDPLSCLTSSEQHKLYAFAGYASARRGWSLRRALSSMRKTLWRR